VTKDDLVDHGVRSGACSTSPPSDIVLKGRLQPGRMFLVDTTQGRIVEDEEIKRRSREKPYRQWLNEHLVHLATCRTPRRAGARPRHAAAASEAFGYTFEDLRMLMVPMARDGVEAIGSMGNDTPLAVLSNKPKLLYDYFKQLFAQVTNPPIDCIREEIVTSPKPRLGSEGNLLNPQPRAAGLIELKWPILTNEDFAKIRRNQLPGLQVGVLPILFNPSPAANGVWPRRWRSSANGPAHDRGGGDQHPHPQRSRRHPRHRSDPRPARRRRPAPLPDPRGHCAPASASCSNPARPAKSITSRLLIGYGCSRSIPTSPSRRSTT
jgi:hypothetical protein